MRSENATPGQRAVPTFISDARQKQIVDCAIEALAEVGYGRASLAEIAKRAGVSKGVILYHFKDKDSLMERVVEDIYARGFQEQFPQVAVEPTFRGMLRRSIETNIRWIIAHPQWIAALSEIFSNFRREDGSPRYSFADNAPIIEGLEMILLEGQKRGEFRQFPTRPMALTIRAAIDQLPAVLEGFPDVDPDAYAVHLADIFDAATRQRD
jgi:TetR/AcrR family transcriptional regulator, fatty acid metabolism regulator protein